jgi:phosphate transport system permease protein
LHAPTTRGRVGLRAAPGRALQERALRGFFFLCGAISILTTLGIIAVLIFETIEFFTQVSFSEFFSKTEWTPFFTNKHFGIWPLVAGTLLVTVIAMLVALPLGLLSAVYLSEYAPARVRAIVKPMLEILAGLPTVVYGYFALMFVTPFLQTFIPHLEVFNALSPGIVMGFMILPMIASLSEDAMRAVPMSLREGAHGLGATRLEVSWRIVLPAAFSGIIAALILAISRAIGETMIVAIAAGHKPTFTLNPLVSIETMAGYIAQTLLGDTPYGSLMYRTLFAVGMALFVMTLVMNVLSYYLVRRFREKYE